MIVKLYRIYDGGNSTLGMLFINKEFECFTLEDEFRESKIPGETRIPSGKYFIKLRQYGGHHQRYSLKFPHFHKGMLQLINVPNFTDILIHIGNYERDTAGCLLVGEDAILLDNGNYKILHSTASYIKLYKKIKNVLISGNSVVIEIFDEKESSKFT